MVSEHDVTTLTQSIVNDIYSLDDCNKDDLRNMSAMLQAALRVIEGELRHKEGA